MGGWWVFRPSGKGLVQGALVVFRVFLLLAAGNVLTLTTPPMALTDGMEWLLKPLGRLKIPCGAGGNDLVCRHSVYPVLLEETETIRRRRWPGAPALIAPGFGKRRGRFSPWWCRCFWRRFKGRMSWPLLWRPGDTAQGCRGPGKRNGLSARARLDGAERLRPALCFGICARISRPAARNKEAFMEK